MRKIAAKVSKRISKLSASKIIDLNEYRRQKKETESLFDDIMTAETAIQTGYDPLHAIYIHTQNLLSVLTEALQAVPEPALNRFFDTIASADELYMPSGPPMSPLTTSYFNCWLLFDLKFGLDQETLTTLTIDLQRHLGLDKNTLAVMQSMQESRMGMYEFMGREGDKVLLRELTRQEVVTCICPSGYFGKTLGELWFARVLKPVIGQFPYSVVFTTPYVLSSHEKPRWEAYLKRTVSQKKTHTTANSLESLMKYGLSDAYWHEYIHQAYVNHQLEAIFLQGLPDVSSTRPHYTGSPSYIAILPDSDMN